MGMLRPYWVAQVSKSGSLVLLVPGANPGPVNLFVVQKRLWHWDSNPGTVTRHALATRFLGPLGHAIWKSSPGGTRTHDLHVSWSSIGMYKHGALTVYATGP